MPPSLPTDSEDFLDYGPPLPVPPEEEEDGDYEDVESPPPAPGEWLNKPIRRGLINIKAWPNHNMAWPNNNNVWPNRH